MAQKATKALAARNSSVLRRTHLTTLSIHTLFLLLHFIFNRPRSLTPYAIFALPTLLIEFYLERLGRPRYNAADGSLRSAGEDLHAAGVTEYLWDILYWTWGCIGATCVFGDRAWWLWIVIPLYSVWLVWTTFRGIQRGGFMGMGGGASPADAEPVAESKRQKKMEKRGGQRVQYR